MAALACVLVRWLHSSRGSARTLRRRQPNGRPRACARYSIFRVRVAWCALRLRLRLPTTCCVVPLRSTVARCVVRGALGPAASYGCVLRTAWCVLCGAYCVVRGA